MLHQDPPLLRQNTRLRRLARIQLAYKEKYHRVEKRGPTELAVVEKFPVGTVSRVKRSGAPESVAVLRSRVGIKETLKGEEQLHYS